MTRRGCSRCGKPIWYDPTDFIQWYWCPDCLRSTREALRELTEESEKLGLYDEA